MATCVLAGWLALGVGGQVAAQVGVGPQPVAYPPAIPAPRDVAFPGVISLAVDATDTRHKLFTVHETIPAPAAGPMVLLYPAWETGSHASTASVAALAGLTVSAGGRAIQWRRDAVDMNAFHIDVPAGAASVELDFQYLTRAADGVMRPQMVNVQWPRMLLYPAGWYARGINVAAQLALPDGMKAFTSLEAGHEGAGTTVFRPTTLETLADSPVYGARHWRQAELAPAGAAPVTLDVLADRAEDLTVPDAELARLRAMVVQAGRLFGVGHFRRYEVIVSLSDDLAVGGIEHLESGENNLPAAYFTAPAGQLNNRDLIAHEYVHSWNGRFRQPADLWTPTFNQPARTSLLWVYEGQTEFWGRVLAARAGMRSRQETLDRLALDAAVTESRPGRAWKSLADSNNDPLFMIGHPVPWRDWQRREDYYPEGVMLWLEVDALIRQHSGGRRSLDDFARAFFGVDGASRVTRTYTFEDVCAALAAVEPYDWAGLLRRRLDGHDAGVLDGLAAAGWRLVYSDTPTETFSQDEAEAGATDLSYSIGLTVTDKGAVRAVAWEGPAFKAGLAPGDRIETVNGKPFSPASLKAAVAASASTPVELGYQADGTAATARIPYAGPLRYPRLERIAGAPDRLAALLAPLGPR
jgi:predicted metalloprotease with PDZ domain